eukprot:scaffold174237_cov15-Tisochrysis_lutea.AAC.1
MCAGGFPVWWTRRQAKVPAKMGFSGISPLACLITGNGWALYQMHGLRGPGAWGGGTENRPSLAGKWQKNKVQHW